MASGSSMGKPVLIPQKKGMTMKEYDELIGLLLSKKEVRGVAVTTPGGEHVLYNKGIPEDMLQVYILALNRIEYMCTVLAREMNPNSRWEYCRIETDDYEMIIAIEADHWMFTYTDSPDIYTEELKEEAKKVDPLLTIAALAKPLENTHMVETSDSDTEELKGVKKFPVIPSGTLNPVKRDKQNPQ